MEFEIKKYTMTALVVVVYFLNYSFQCHIMSLFLCIIQIITWISKQRGKVDYGDVV